MSEENDLIYGVHPVTEALNNPRRKLVSLKASKNAADRLADEIGRARVPFEIVHPRELDRKLGEDAVHQGLLLEAKPLAQPRLDQIEKVLLVLQLGSTDRAVHQSANRQVTSATEVFRGHPDLHRGSSGRESHEIIGDLQ